MTSDHAQSTGSELRRLRRARRITIAELARRLDVDPRTVTRWETAEAIPPKALPALLEVFPELVEGALTGTAGEAGPLLHEATHVELLAELARRIAAVDTPDQELPPVPQVKLSWPRSAAPSARRVPKSEDADRGRSTTP